MPETREASRDKSIVSWAVEPDEKVWLQTSRIARLPFVESPVAQMADAHVGIGSTVGTVIATRDAVIPAAIGVDIGCGMVASETTLYVSDLPDLTPLMEKVTTSIPAGVGQGHEFRGYSAPLALRNLGLPTGTRLTDRQRETVMKQYGTMGSGNHFGEIGVDERGRVWTVLHSGSRGIGNQLARRHIDGAKGLMKERLIHLEDPDLAYLSQGEPEFEAYISDMLWCQRYAAGSRAVMNAALTTALFEVAGKGAVTREINCHHNFTQLEIHHGQQLWITRKGAIKAATGDSGIIPGSMGAATFIVSGLGNTQSYMSSSHGAGRTMSRSQAKRNITPGRLAEQMAGRVWNSDKAADLTDEGPDSYKDIDAVMAAQSDLVKIEHRLEAVFNYKGVK